MGKQGHLIVAALAGLAAGQVNLTKSFAFQFDGCCRGGAARTWKLIGSDIDFNGCAQNCLDSSTCNAIEVNGCNRFQCKGNCFHFYGDGVDLYNGCKPVDGTQKCYEKMLTPDPACDINFLNDSQAQCYLNRYSDLRAGFGPRNTETAKKHWVKSGCREQRDPSCPKELNDQEAQCYLNRYPDLIRDIAKAKQHYLAYGIDEGRSYACDVKACNFLTDSQAQCYLNRYSDLRAGFGPRNIETAKSHWLNNGCREQRDPSCPKELNDQEAQCYLNRYPDLIRGFGMGNIAKAKEHYLAYGIGEGRSYACVKAPTPTPTPLPTPVPTPVPTPIVNLKSGGGWKIVKGSCSINMTTGKPCVVSGNYPENYRGEEECRVNTTGVFSFATFSTEKWFDYVKVGDVEYSGNMTGRLASGSELIWSSDFYIEGPGWMICQTKEETPKV